MTEPMHNEHYGVASEPTLKASKSGDRPPYGDKVNPVGLASHANLLGKLEAIFGRFSVLYRECADLCLFDKSELLKFVNSTCCGGDRNAHHARCISGTQSYEAVVRSVEARAKGDVGLGGIPADLREVFGQDNAVRDHDKRSGGSRRGVAEILFAPTAFAFIAGLAKDLQVLKIKPFRPMGSNWLNVIDVDYAPSRFGYAAAHALSAVLENCLHPNSVPFPRGVKC